MQDLRCYSASNGGSTMNNGQTQIPYDIDKFKKSKYSEDYTAKSASTSACFCLTQGKKC
ncbi:hypothetical protein Godav_003769 [Gossypium davidsonii]|uniref:Uncharacterized protein n=2 Tax=Gossypium TaxID=3633 RepID=A0A7J8SKA7_GOSDV|nr:hypothetical protein [Gossypium davidsonii]MBA0661625.1 hypothetical protein [Gossypium klotzschianum]